MPDVITDRKITQDEAGQLMAPMELDLIAAFKIIQEDIMIGMEGYEGTPEEYINEVLESLQEVEPETVVLKSIQDDLDILKGKPLPPGTRRQREDGIYIKQPDGTWIKETEEKGKKEVEISDEDKEKIEEYKKEPMHRLKQQLSGIEFQLKPFENKDISKLDRFQRMAYDTYKNQQKLLQIAIKEKEKKKESKKTEQQLKEQKENIIQNLDKKHFVDSTDINNIVSYVKEKYPEAKGVRFVEFNFKEYDYQKGDELPESKQWIEGEPTDITLGGTSTIRTDEFFTPHKEGGYGATKIFIVGGSDISSGEDPNEGIVNDAFIIDVIEIPNNIKKSMGGNMPQIKPGESEEDFVSRCIPIVMREGSTQEQAAGKCYGMYRNAQKAKDGRPPKEWWDRTVSALRQKKEIDDPEALAGWIWYHHKESDLSKGKPPKTVEGYESPAPGDISGKERDILARVYAESRKKGYDKERSAQIAWGAVKQFRGGSAKKSVIIKSLNFLIKTIIKNL